MSDRRTTAGRSADDGRRGRVTRRQWLARAGGLAAGAADVAVRHGGGGGLARGPGARAGPAEARRHAPRRHRGQARQHGPGLRAALLVAPGLPERLQQAASTWTRPASSSPGSRSRGSRRTRRAGSSTWSTTPSSTTASRSPPRTWRSRSGRILDAKNKLPMRVFFTPVEGVEAVGPYQARFHLSRPYGPLLAVLVAGHRGRQREGARRQGPEALPDRHRAVSSSWSG